MSAEVVPLFEAREACSSKKWSNQDVAEIYRVASTLSRAGLPIECEEGQTDEGDRWYAFCNANTGDVIVHFARIDDRFVAQVCHLSVSFSGYSFSEIVNQFLNTYPVVLPDQKSSNSTRIWMHPASGLAAFVATLYFLVELTKGSSAQAAEVGQAIEDLPESALDAVAAAKNEKSQPSYQPAKQLTRWEKLENSSTFEGPRVIALTAAAIIAGILMDAKRSDNFELTFDPNSVFEGLRSFSEFHESIDGTLEAVVAAVEAQIAKLRSEMVGPDGSVRTAHNAGNDTAGSLLGEASLENVEVDLDGDKESLLIDLEAELGVADRQLRDRAQLDADMFAAVNDQGQIKDADSEGGRNVHTIATSDDATDNDDLGVTEDNDASANGENGETNGSSTPLFVEPAQDSGTASVLISLGLKSPSEGDLNSLLDVVADTGFSFETGSEDPVTTAALVLPQADSGPTASTDPVSSSSSAEPSSSGLPVNTGSSTGDVGSGTTAPTMRLDDPPFVSNPMAPQPPRIADTPSLVGPSGDDVLLDPMEQLGDFSAFDPVEVLRTFLVLVEDVRYAEVLDSFYLYDALSVATKPPQELEVESVILDNGDEVNMVGQALTFEAMFDVLSSA
ncbi:MAG: hypothetical protein RIC14_08385 [Filomicrobium sp.]